ncbi:hypothetical protein DAPPUDRAFT_125694 [Daphnia pulex]|uniref:Uncharacterized protein n=1 Tax=Daphnia pulex TaxID=6669 RepID=E9I7I3_DAPPU|nr:hypothetical protein DAPPUDRAFT_125694 [Daphnia pulex]|eukprot:EFX60047.1 hypothetical protein DAPPUDRAFT_125694 [Daphnia pulex]
MWKKQMLANKNKTNDPPKPADNVPSLSHRPPPTPTLPRGLKIISPPWAKQGQDASNNNPNKTNTTVPASQNPPANQPAWMKGNSNVQETSPGWANKNAGSSPQANWANKGGVGQTAPPNPPWMKSGETSVPQNSNLQRAQKIADMEKEKKEMEEKQRLLEEEERERKKQ